MACSAVGAIRSKADELHTGLATGCLFFLVRDLDDVLRQAASCRASWSGGQSRRGLVELSTTPGITVSGDDPAPGAPRASVLPGQIDRFHRLVQAIRP